MSETTDGVVGVWPSGFREASLGALTEALEDEMTTLYPVVGDPSFVDLESDYISDEEELKALPGASEEFHKRTRGKFSRPYRLAAEPLTDVMAWGTGNIESSAASSAANEVQTLDVTGITAGKFKLRDRRTGLTTIELNFDVTNTDFDTALETVVGAGNVAVTLASSVYTMTFGGALAATDMPELELIVTVPAVGGDFVLETTAEGQASGQYTHTIQEPSICDLNPHSFPYAEGARCDGVVDSFKFYPGMVVNSAGWDIGNDDFINLVCDFLQCGKEESAADFSFPSSDSARTIVTNTDVELWLGDSFTDPFKLAEGEFIAFSVKFNFNLVEPERISSLKTVPEYQYPKGGMSIDLSGTFKGGKSSRFYAMIDACRFGYRPKLRVKLNPRSTPQRPITLTFNKLTIPSGRIVAAGREQRTELTFHALSNTTDNGRFTLETVTAISAYLQLAT